MRNYGTIEEVMDAYVNKKEGPHTGNSRSVFFEDNVIYSYGRHFPLTIRLKCGTYLINGDFYSVTTSQHQRRIAGHIVGGWGRKEDKNESFTTSLSALERTGAKRDGSNIILVDKRKDLRKYNKDAVKWLKENPKDHGGVTIHRHLNHKSGKEEIFYIHRPGSTLLRIDRKYWICGMDENSYFVSRLPRRCYDISEAFEMLKPDEVREYEVENKTQAVRQGEWFFIPQDLMPAEARKEYKNMEMKYVLPRELGGNPHIATRGIQKSRKKLQFVSGQIRHPEHRTIRLSTLRNIKIFQAVVNTAKESYSAEGRVD